MKKQTKNNSAEWKKCSTQNNTGINMKRIKVWTASDTICIKSFHANTSLDQTAAAVNTKNNRALFFSNLYQRGQK